MIHLHSIYQYTFQCYICVLSRTRGMQMSASHHLPKSAIGQCESIPDYQSWHLAQHRLFRNQRKVRECLFPFHKVLLVADLWIQVETIFSWGRCSNVPSQFYYLPHHLNCQVLMCIHATHLNEKSTTET